MKNKITDLRERLFETIESLQNKNSPMDIERAKAIAEVAQVIVNSAKVEVDFMRIDGVQGTGFIEEHEIVTEPEIPQIEGPEEEPVVESAAVAPERRFVPGKRY